MYLIFYFFLTDMRMWMYGYENDGKLGEQKVWADWKKREQIFLITVEQNVHGTAAVSSPEGKSKTMLCKVTEVDAKTL